MFDRFLTADAAAAWPWEVVPEPVATELRLASPRTNLGRCRGRFRLLAGLLAPHVARGASICDVGAYPGTLLRLLRRLPGGDRVRLGAAGLGFDDPFRRAMAELGVSLAESEFDVRATPAGVDHLLAVTPDFGHWDVVVCTEVLEHQLQPLALLVGCNRLLHAEGAMVLTTNSASFIGDALKLLAGRHNVEALARSHVLLDDDWRPHIRLYLLEEILQLLELTGFRTERGSYFDGGNVYTGAKGAGIGTVRRIAGVVPRLRSHIVVEARRAGEPAPQTWQRLDQAFGAFGLTRPVPHQPAAA